MDRIMRLVVFSFSFIFYSGFSFSQSLMNYKNMSLVNGCRIFNMAGLVLLSLPGERCLFLKNGDYVSQAATHTKYFSKNHDLVWTIDNPYFHHQMNFSNDETHLLLMGSLEKEVGGELLRLDLLLTVDLKTGKVITQIESDQIFSQVNQPSLDLENTFPKLNFKTVKEHSHFNSFYQIPKFKNKPKDPLWLKEGNYIANSTNAGIFILNSDLSKVLHHFVLESSYYHAVHDAQINSQGNLLAFVNVNFSLERIKYSSVIERDLRVQKDVLRVESSPKQMFFSEFCGGVQELLDGDIFFSHNFAGSFLYDKNEKKITYSNFAVFKDGIRILPSQQIKMLDLTSFFKNHRQTVF